MMSYQPPANDPLFSVNVQLETRVRKDHPLRKIKELLDFDLIYKEVEKTYGRNGTVSVPPPVILKLMLLLIRYNVRSERELMDTCPRAVGLACGFLVAPSSRPYPITASSQRREHDGARTPS
jgi:transposase